jgi:hypothetical protein
MNDVLAGQACYVGAGTADILPLDDRGVCLPSLGIVQAINLPAVPLPCTRTSYLSAAFMGGPF